MANHCPTCNVRIGRNDLYCPACHDNNQARPNGWVIERAPARPSVRHYRERKND
jgi:hypothetical protein